MCKSALTVMFAILAVGVLLPLRAQGVAGQIDGSKNPELVANDEIHVLLFLTATTPTSGPRDVESRRAQAFVHSLPLSPADQAVFAQEAQAYRSGREKLEQLSGSMAQRTELGQQTMDDLYKRLSAAGFLQLKAFAEREKRSVKLVPLPPMKPLAKG